MGLCASTAGLKRFKRDTTEWTVKGRNHFKRCKRDAAQPRVEDAKRPEPWVNVGAGNKPCRGDAGILRRSCRALVVWRRFCPHMCVFLMLTRIFGLCQVRALPYKAYMPLLSNGRWKNYRGSCS